MKINPVLVLLLLSLATHLKSASSALSRSSQRPVTTAAALTARRLGMPIRTLHTPTQTSAPSMSFDNSLFDTWVKQNRAVQIQRFPRTTPLLKSTTVPRLSWQFQQRRGFTSPARADDRVLEASLKWLGATPKSNAFGTLGLPNNATPAQIEQASTKLVDDINTSSLQADIKREMFDIVIEAYKRAQEAAKLTARGVAFSDQEFYEKAKMPFNPPYSPPSQQQKGPQKRPVQPTRRSPSDSGPGTTGSPSDERGTAEIVTDALESIRDWFPNE